MTLIKFDKSQSKSISPSSLLRCFHVLIICLVIYLFIQFKIIFDDRWPMFSFNDHQRSIDDSLRNNHNNDGDDRNESSIFKLLDYHYGHLRFDNDFSSSNNETGFDEFIVPNLIHYIQLENPFMDFITMISILSVVRNHRPSLLLIHTDRNRLRGKYWEQIKILNSSETSSVMGRIFLRKIKRPKRIFHRKLSSIYHASDIARIRILQQYGGIYLDNDVFVVNSLDRYRKFEIAIGWPYNQNIGMFHLKQIIFQSSSIQLDLNLGTQIIVCHRNARFLKLWIESYHQYRPDRWYFNAGELPTQTILKQNPSLVHRVPERFGVTNLVQMLYGSVSDGDWEKKFDTIHLLARHRSYMINDRKIRFFNEYNIQTYNGTFGEMARSVYYGSKRLL
ncbi:hypothetical protein SSS_03155 [Sarcoptes scabiei]|uniref:Uncharacterized protein n=1 Tax=Sarcoptes scabiei TaxID=52283 RepID=A0A834RBU6_SARSC|nr:hypothetical protein SSS_03155 [Sarcoptes scabiei]